jgi:ATP-dependent Clp protease ATP-binding subunit ClpA
VAQQSANVHGLNHHIVPCLSLTDCIPGPDAIQGTRVLLLDMAALLPRTLPCGEFERRFHSVLSDVGRYDAHLPFIAILCFEFCIIGCAPHALAAAR